MREYRPQARLYLWLIGKDLDLPILERRSVQDGHSIGHGGLPAARDAITQDQIVTHVERAGRNDCGQQDPAKDRVDHHSVRLR